ncbi:unnamed protein product (macronuclear) [Paramecium tetraurelia]|uniref:Uncharacterized protein n=1 Tax=Paramecium tetraurelia TaxID=5888 RepID=A0DCI4_PARTE|nr:uncharacterized protein GSPATT00015629001 [Paramecium tetraurelia]CAK80751.1 unnamed protein product [Paramecium tetraurelia]|eukprot:XP_001448148.1 hypothetical protein (macronuclear) [Paramecium tetraurelia strain d4-2]
MGTCSSQAKQKGKNIQTKPNQNELDTNLNSGQKQPASQKQVEIEECPKQSHQEAQEQVEKKEIKSDLQNVITDEEAIKQYLLGEELSEVSMQMEKDLSAQIQQKISFKDKKQIVSVIKALFLCLKKLEEPIYQLDKKYPSEILNNFQQFLQQSLQDLFEYNINLVKNEQILQEGIELCCRTYHVLQNLGKKLKTQKAYAQGVQDEELTISEELKKQYLKVQSEIKLEIIRTFQNKNEVSKSQQQQQNNPLVLMKFNTKHAITLAKQQTLKQQAGDDEDSQSLQSLQKALEYDIQYSQYDTSNMKPKKQQN